MVQSIGRGIRRLQKLNLCIYLLVMTGCFPLFYFRQYEQIGTAKYTLFWYSSVSVLGIWASLFLVQLSAKVVNERKKWFLADWNVSFMDMAVLTYGLFVLLSYLFSDFKDYAGKGAAGWEMGLYAQLIFLALYFVLAHTKTWIKPVLAIHFLSSGLVFLLGILHRFDVDPLGMYPGLTVFQKQEFLSTIGQATWYSSYVCTVFAMGLMVHYFSRRLWVQVATGVYIVISFATLVTQNSDSAFMALLAVILLLGLFSFQKTERLLRFLQIMTILWGTFGSVGIFQRIFADRMIPLDTLSLFFSQSIWVWILFALTLASYLFLDNLPENRQRGLLPLLRRLYLGALAVLGVGAVLLIFFIIINTKGLGLEWFGWESRHSYFYFDQQWGNNRGLSWMTAWESWKTGSWKEKLIGAGPDCFAPFVYRDSEREALLRGLWGNLTLTNAHNEYLNHLVCYGLGGLVSWLTVLVGGIVYFYRKAKEKPFFIGFALCLAGYLLHNLFCYQQVCCTPFVFLLLGLGEGLTKWEKSPTIIENE